MADSSQPLNTYYRVQRFEPSGALWTDLGGFDQYFSEAILWNGQLVLYEHHGELYAGGTFNGYLRRWDGSSWVQVGDPAAFGGCFGGVNSLASYNGDLIVGGGFSCGATGILRWDGTSYGPMAPGTPGVPNVGNLVAMGGDLWMNGAFNSAGGLPSSGIALWRDEVPWVLVEPAAVTVNAGEEVTFSVDLYAPSFHPVSLQWLHDGEEIEGATLPTLTLSNIQSADAGEYACRMDGLCGFFPFSVTSPAATLTVAGAGAPAATVTGAVLRKPNTAGPGGVCDLPIDIVVGAPISSEPRTGGVTEVRIAFDVAPGDGGGDPVAIEEAVNCGAAPSYGPYTGAAAATASVEGNELVLAFAPALENARTYRITPGPAVTSVAGQFVELRALLGDVDGSGRANATDRSLVVAAWTSPANFTCDTDLDSSGRTNSIDRSSVVAGWTSTQNCAP
jgi:hypothetical protein